MTTLNPYIPQYCGALGHAFLFNKKGRIKMGQPCICGLKFAPGPLHKSEMPREAIYQFETTEEQQYGE